MRLSAVFLLFGVLLVPRSVLALTKVACVGDSITFGYGLSDRVSQAYPTVLGTLLGSEYRVGNFGVNSATLLASGSPAYTSLTEYQQSNAFAPNVVVIMLGTNDAKPQNWAHEADFVRDYQALIEHYRELGAEVFVTVPPPVYDPGAFEISPSTFKNQVVPRIREVALSVGAPLIDVYAALDGHSEYFPDKVHPDARGARVLAETVFAALSTSSGGSGGSGGAPAGGTTGAAGGVGAAGAGVTGGSTNGGADRGAGGALPAAGAGGVAGSSSASPSPTTQGSGFGGANESSAGRGEARAGSESDGAMSPSSAAGAVVGGAGGSRSGLDAGASSSPVTQGSGCAVRPLSRESRTPLGVLVTLLFVFGGHSLRRPKRR